MLTVTSYQAIFLFLAMQIFV